MATHKNDFDLFAGLAALGKKELAWFDSLSEAGKKAAAPFVMMRWMTGTSDQLQILRLNRYVNPYVFAGSADKSALFKLLAATATGRNVRYGWLKGPGSKARKLSIDVICQYYDCSTREAATYKVDAETILEMVDELGWDKDEIAKLKKELDDGSGPTKTSSAKPKKLVGRPKRT